MGCPLEKINESWTRAHRATRSRRKRACQEIVITGQEMEVGPGPRRPAGADLDARLGHRALHHALAVHHQGSRHRRAEHGHLPRPGEGAAAARHEPVARAAAGHLHALGKGEEARPEAAPPRWCSARRRASPSPRRRSCRRRSTSCTSPAALVGAPINVVKAKTVDLLVPAEAEIVDRGLHRHRVPRARGAVRRVARPRQPAGVQRLHGGHRASRGAATPSSPRSSPR